MNASGRIAILRRLWLVGKPVKQNVASGRDLRVQAISAGVVTFNGNAHRWRCMHGVTKAQARARDRKRKDDHGLSAH